MQFFLVKIRDVVVHPAGEENAREMYRFGKNKTQ